MHIYLCDLRARNSLCISCSLIIGFFFLCVDIRRMSVFRVEREFECEEKHKAESTYKDYRDRWTLKEDICLGGGKCVFKMGTGFFVGWFRRFFYCGVDAFIEEKFGLTLWLCGQMVFFVQMISGKEWWASGTFTWVWDIFSGDLVEVVRNLSGVWIWLGSICDDELFSWCTWFFVGDFCLCYSVTVVSIIWDTESE